MHDKTAVRLSSSKRISSEITCQRTNERIQHLGRSDREYDFDSMNPAFQDISKTDSYNRILQRLARFGSDDGELCVGHLVLSIVADQSLGSACLKQLGITISKIRDGCFGSVVARAAKGLPTSEASAFEKRNLLAEEELKSRLAQQAGWLNTILDRVTAIARHANTAGTSSEDLLRAIADVDGPARKELERLGVGASQIHRELGLEAEAEVAPLPVEFELETESNDSKSITNESVSFEQVLTVLDANLNRSREGLRVLDDFARFVARSAELTKQLKQIRHGLVDSETLLRSKHNLIRFRNVERDAGTAITIASESSRTSFHDLVLANARRVQESLRSLEEFGKLVSPEFAEQIKQLRYRSYSLEQELCIAVDKKKPSAARKRRLEILRAAKLYVLVTEASCQLPWKTVVEQALAGGAKIVQLREKELNEEELVARGQWIAERCREREALFILNDRHDLVEACRADGVHIGQDDGDVENVRACLGNDLLIGVSTHNVSQLYKAAGQHVDYLGVGPVFQSQTKEFCEFAGLEFVRQASLNARLPWFAIGGIDVDSVGAVIDAGCQRVAVSSTILRSSKPDAAAAELASILPNPTNEPS